MGLNLNPGSHLISNILQNTTTDRGLAYTSDKEDKKEAALNYAEDIIKVLEQDYNKNHETLDRGILNAAELGSVTKYEDKLTELNLDDEEGLSKEELASYILASDSLIRLKDAAYAGWEFLPDAAVTEEDLKISVYNKSLTDGVISEDNIFALENMNTKDLKAAAQEIYDANFKKEDTGLLAFIKLLFIH